MTAPPAKKQAAPSPSDTPGARAENHENRVNDAQFVAGATSIRSLPPPVLAEVAFAGRSNVGKSSLLNTMMQRKGLARTSGTPGCTQQINVFHLTMNDGLSLHFVDLPGYGYARVSKAKKGEWGPMLEGYLLERATLRAVAVLVDVRRGLEEDDLQLLEFLATPRGISENKPIDRIVVVTKIDKLPVSRRKPALQTIFKQTQLPIVGFSAETGDGRDELWRKLRAAL